MKKLFSFPNPVNDASARTVALGVVTMSVVAFATNQAWVLIPLTYGFLARLAAGPTLSPLGQFAVRVSGPRIKAWQKFVPGPPKRFAQGIGATFSVAACVVWFGFDQSGAARVLVGMVTVAAALESILALCLGCTLFAFLMRVGVIPESVCERCSDIFATQS